MDIYVYDMGAVLLGITDMVSSLLWTRRFFKGDSFEAVFPATEKNLRLIKQNNIIEIPHKYCGFITSLEVSSTGEGEIIKAGGVSIDGMLSRRILAYGSSSDSLITVLDKNAGSQALTRRQFENTFFDNSVSCPSMYNRALRYKNLADYVEIVGQIYAFGVAAEISHGETNSIRFYGRYGVDRSTEQAENIPVVFSELYGNITDCQYSFSTAGMVNSSLVYTVGEYNDSKKVDIEEYTYFSSPPSGVTGYLVAENAIEMESAVTTEKRTESGSTVDWEVTDIAANYENAKDEAAAAIVSETECVSAKLLLGENYRERFDLGDVVTIQCSRWDKLMHRRIYEITEFYGEGGLTIEAVVGTPKKNLNELLKI